LNKKEERIPFGIASSVAATSGFDWMKTIEIANQLEVSDIQFHLNQYNPSFDWDGNLSSFNDVYVHLPPNFKFSHPFIKSVGRISNRPFLIQHERYLNQEDITYFKEHQLPLGFENDQNNNLNAYFDRLKQLSLSGLNLSAVMDCPRFYHQFYQHHSEEEILNQIISIFEWCKENQIPVTLHVIDIANYNQDHSNWVPIFDGILPWDNILSYVLESLIPVKSIILEYEDEANTEKSVYSLREWFKK